MRNTLKLFFVYYDHKAIILYEMIVSPFSYDIVITVQYKDNITKYEEICIFRLESYLSNQKINKVIYFLLFYMKLKKYILGILRITEFLVKMEK